ncbi:UDP-3-O-(3-hydroxymyristoyl)glucosamine N-acyltransferase [Pseudobacteriovorax antillogorgiicola]|uniref:UDP-3-O-acylglucosamine N-acyltransferase n=1 Tax=Pseudobacteriovorax antillogorgiicola TaxID=1513793 RepID=A0A1Y6BPB5_9BACT|nr:UDP-3-O-(3-hydroxymyristoyl)glucosamine N-acyltransferase [Pseudobacteriovorax antillogorgiicola]TCS53785.1 UDP-3-O-[3-hydroxymyristoyl] glucosamine N-acyltransferase [Pseudobacteriovorax antillogorgiicola]SMF22273.1 UDP-3-O-[3-hydroxymyristoyl] glucosamine N-acyltransferase [Pseudobacteriovorax antillogorgiicola]
MQLQEIASQLKIDVIWPEGADQNVDISGVAPIDGARTGTISFIADTKYLDLAKKTGASALITRDEIPNCPVPQLIHRDPHYAFARTANLFYQPDHGPNVISDKVEVHPSVQLGEHVTVYPFVCISPGAVIGDHVVLYPGVFIGADAIVGANSVLYANVVVGERCQVGERNIIHPNSVLGADGFGFAVGDGEIVKIPQTGIAKTEDDVELGACCTIDRAALGETVVKRGTKFDDHVHVGHNSTVGENCMFAAMVAIAGSTKIGNWCLAGGQAAVAGHIEVGDKVRIGAKAGIISSVEGGQMVMGFPEQPAMQWRRARAMERKLPEMAKKMKAMEARLAELEIQLGERKSSSNQEPPQEC